MLVFMMILAFVALVSLYFLSIVSRQVNDMTSELGKPDSNFSIE